MEGNKFGVERKVLGIDPGTGRCGWAVVKLKIKRAKLKIERNLELVDCGCIETKARTPLPERLEIIYKKIAALIKSHRPGEMAVEEIFFVKNVKTGISVAQARGVVILAGRLAGLEIFEYKPNEIKLGVTGYGHADKNQMRQMLKLHLKGCMIKQDDAADAVAVALHHLQRRKLRA